MQKILSILLSAVMLLSSNGLIVFATNTQEKTEIVLVSANDDFAGGDGTMENPYQIATANHLNNVRNYSNAYFVQTDDIDMSVATSKGGDYWNDGNGWTPISTFSGVYDGNGKEIRGVNCFVTSTNKGLFGTVNGGTIKNLGVVDSNFNDTLGSTANKGSIAGYVINGVVRNCYTSNNIISADTTNVGGIVGYLTEGSSVSYCYNTGKLIGGKYVGGIVGNSEGKHISGTSTVISNNVLYCSNTANIQGKIYVGGILGISKITNIGYSYNTGRISMEENSSSGNSIGGIAGSQQAGGVSNCFNSGDVISNSNVNAGGILGKALNYYLSARSTATGVRINNCYNKASISSDSSNYSIGGILGLSQDTLSSSNFSPTIIITNCYNSGNIYYAVSLKVGKGIAGRYNYTWGITETKIEKNYTLSETSTSSTGVAELSADDMKLKLKYSSFDFSAVWDISPEVNNGYPYLRGVGNFTPLTKTTAKAGSDYTQFDVSFEKEMFNAIILIVVSNNEGHPEKLISAECNGDTSYTITMPFLTASKTAKVYIWKSLKTLLPLGVPESVEIEQTVLV